MICDIETLVENLLRGRVSTRCTLIFTHTRINVQTRSITRSIAYYVESLQSHVRTFCLLTLSFSLSLYVSLTRPSSPLVSPVFSQANARGETRVRTGFELAAAKLNGNPASD